MDKLIKEIIKFSSTEDESITLKNYEDFSNLI